MKPIKFLGSSLKDLTAFPTSARKVAGFELQKVQHGLDPRDFKPMISIGAGVQELRVWVEAGTYRVIYLAKLADAVYVLHAFEKKTRATADRDIELARERYKSLAGK